MRTDGANPDTGSHVLPVMLARCTCCAKFRLQLHASSQPMLTSMLQVLIVAGALLFHQYCPTDILRTGGATERMHAAAVVCARRDNALGQFAAHGAEMVSFPTSMRIRSCIENRNRIRNGAALNRGASVFAIYRCRFQARVRRLQDSTLGSSP